MIRRFAAVAVCAFFALPLLAEDKGQGFIVTAEEAVIYKNAESDETVGTLAKGESLVGFRGASIAGHNNNWVAMEKNDRYRINYLRTNSRGNPVPSLGWVRKADVTAFSYECGCGPKTGPLGGDTPDLCNPMRYQGRLANTSYSWNLCFTDGRDAKLAATTPAAAPAQPTVEERLTKLKELLDKGLLTKEEYEKKRAEIVSSL